MQSEKYLEIDLVRDLLLIEDKALRMRFFKRFKPTGGRVPAVEISHTMQIEGSENINIAIDGEKLGEAGKTSKEISKERKNL